MIDKNYVHNLISDMKKADTAYWNGKPIIEDSQYDDYYFKLKQLHHKYPKDKVITAYLTEVHGPKKNNTFTHRRQLYYVRSLDKTRTVKAVSHFLNKWNTNKKSLWYTDSFLLERKEDGLSIILYFNDKRMHRQFVALTRGGGVVGDDVTNEVYHYNRMNINKILKRMHGRHFVVRGEALIGDKDFKRVNKLHNGKWANSRNLASGSIMNKNASTAGKRGVFMSVYTLINRDDWLKQYPTELDQLRLLRSLGFFIIKDVHRFPNTVLGKRQMLKFMFRFSIKQRKAIGHPIDGMVIKPNYTVNEHKIGHNSHGPRYSVSWKFAPKSAIGVLQTVRWQESANGKLTPVGILQHPVHIMGAMISKASLASVPDIKQRDLRLYDHVVVRRMNDVIPKFIKPVKALRTGKEVPITNTLPKGAIRRGAYYYMPDIDDSLPVILERWSKFVSKPCLNIMGLSTKIVAKMIKAHVIDSHDFSSLWKINKSRFLQMQGCGPKDWSHLQSQLIHAKDCPLDRVLLGLPINNAGSYILKPIARRIGHMKPLLNDINRRFKMQRELVDIMPKIKGYGKADIPIIRCLFSSKIITQLQNLAPYLQLTEPVSHATYKKSKITGMHFAITGKLSHPRKFFAQMIKSYGAKLQNSVNSRTDYLICNQASHSSKYRKAKLQGTKIITDQQFRTLLKP